MMRFHRRILIVIGGAVSGAAFSLLAACSSSDTTTEVPTVDAAPRSTGDSATNPTDSATPPEGDAGTGDAASECGTPAKLHPVTAGADGGNIYCPFSATDAGKTEYCTNDQQCCETPSGTSPSTCETKGSACPVTGSTVWECEDPSDCASGMQCCARSTGAGVTVGTDTCGPYLSKFSGTYCAATCATGELVVCEAQAACATGTCTAVKPKGNSIGVCN